MTLKNAMRINAVSSGATGLLLLLFPGYTASLFGASTQTPFVATGVFLLLFALFVLIQSSKIPINKRWVRLIIILDVLWVLESLLIVLPGMFGFSTLGYLVIAAVALWVALMVALQTKGLSRMSTSHS